MFFSTLNVILESEGPDYKLFKCTLEHICI